MTWQTFYSSRPFSPQTNDFLYFGQNRKKGVVLCVGVVVCLLVPLREAELQLLATGGAKFVRPHHSLVTALAQNVTAGADVDGFLCHNIKTAGATVSPLEL
jgi:hypothetical protein